MTDIFRKSPVSFDRDVERTEAQNGFKVVLKYEDEGAGPFLVDLSHAGKWDLQDADLSNFTPFGIKIPDTIGQVSFEDGFIVNRMNRTQAAIWQVSRGRDRRPPAEPSYTETTDGLALLSLIGRDIFSIMETISDLDLRAPKKNPPFFLQGPVRHIPCQIVVPGGFKNDPILLLAFSRGYGQAMADAILEAGKPWRLRPGGQKAFDRRTVLSTR